MTPFPCSVNFFFSMHSVHVFMPILIPLGRTVHCNSHPLGHSISQYIKDSLQFTFHKPAVCRHSLLILSPAVRFLISAQPKHICYDTPAGQKLRLLVDNSSGGQGFSGLFSRTQLSRIKRAVKHKLVDTMTVHI